MIKDGQNEILKNAPFGYAYHKVILDSSDNPVDYKILEVNTEFERITGLNKDKIIDKKITEVVPGIREEFDWISIYAEIALNGGEQEFEQYSEPLNKYYRVKVYSPKKYHFVTIFTDITAEIDVAKSSQQLLEHEEDSIDYQSITDNLIDISGAKYIAFNKFDEDGKSFRTMAISGINKNIQKAVNILGFDLIGKKWSHDPERIRKIKDKPTTYFETLRDLTGDTIPKQIISTIEKVFDIGQVALVKITKDGIMLGDFTIIMPQGQKLRHEKLIEIYAQQVGLYLDRKKAQIELEKSKKRYKTVFENTGAGTIIIEDDTTIALVNRKFEELTGYSREEIEGKKSWTEFIVEEDLERMKKYHSERRKEHKNPPNQYEFKFIDREDEVHDMVVIVDTIPNTDQSVASFLDITKRKQTEQQLKESEEKYRRLVETTGDIIIIHDNEGIIKFANQSTLKFSNYDREEIVGKNISEFLPESEQETLLERKKKREKNKIKQRFHFETTFINKEGQKIGVDVQSTPQFQNGEYQQSLIVARDISKRKQAEKEREQFREQLYQKQKLESIGTLAGGIAHDFNNLLTVILGVSSLAQRKTKEEKLGSNLEQIHDAGKKAARLTDQLLLYSREKETEFEVHNLNNIINDMEKMLKRLIGEDIVIHNELDNNVWNVKADEGQIEQVLTNLIINAKDSMPDGGEIFLKTRNMTLDKNKARQNKDIQTGDYVLLEIEDTGQGIEKEKQEKIFDPFFTTKSRAEGTGMGLSVVQGIIKGHNGIINVDSKPNEGTTFKIYIPAYKEEFEQSSPQGPEDTKEYFGQGETILVVEDEDTVLNYLKDILDYYNYNYYTARSGEEALKIFDTKKEEIDLLLSDIVMAGMSGLELADKLKDKKADLQVILSSGYSDQKISHSAIQEKGYEFIRKPYEINNFLRVLQEKLN